MEIKHINTDIQFLSGGGEMGRLTREKDWAATSLGEPQFWPQSLRTTLSIILNSKFPMFLFWGKELTCFYNDAYRPSLGRDGKHPSMLGMKAEEAWQEIWHIIKPLIDQVLTSGEATWSEDQLIPIYRNGKLEDVYWTFSYSPVNDESGKPSGVFITCSETTEKVMAYSRVQESKNELEFAIEATELGTWDYNPLTNKFSANDRLKNWFGLSGDEQIELAHAVNAIADHDKQKVNDTIQQALTFSSGGNYDVEYTIIHPLSKKETIVHAKGRAWFNEAEMPYRFNGTLEDVTAGFNARKQIELSEARFRSLINQSPLAMVVFRGPEQVIEMANSAMLKRWGKTGQDLENKRFIDVFPEMRDQKITGHLDQVYRSGKPYRELETASYIQHGNATSYVDFEYSPLLDAEGNVSGVIATVNDVTEKVVSRKKIEESEARYHNLIYSSPSAIGILYGEDLVITIANDAIIQIWGKGREIMGKPYFEALPELAEQGYKEVFGQVYKTGIPFNAVETPVYIIQDGVMTLKYYNFLLFAQKDINGNIDGVGIIATEVTSQALLNKKIKESEQRFAAAVEAVKGIVWTNNEKGEMSGEQPGWAALTGQHYDEYQGHGWANAIHPDDVQPTIEAWHEALKTGNIFNFEHRVKLQDGTWRAFAVKAIPLQNEDGSIREWVGVHTDIQKQKSFATELERQVQERTKQLEQTNIELEKMNKELQSFAYISSHDLQEPLRKIQTFSSIIMSKEHEHLSDMGKDYFGRMQNAALRMQTLIDDLLAYSRTNSADRKFEHVHLSEIVDEIKADFREELKLKDATIEATELCEVDIIPFQFRQLLQNLVSNSLKFSAPDRALKIKIMSERATGKELHNERLLDNTCYCHIRISDNGIGFEQQFSDRIFELFQRLHGRQEYHGTGIGLAIVKKIVENHEGIITANGAPDEGATFDIFLPVK